jgi:hypothetical protein
MTGATTLMTQKKISKQTRFSSALNSLVVDQKYEEIEQLK